MRLVIAKIAQQEFNDAKKYYEIEQSGLGTLFENEIKKTLLRLLKYPESGVMEKSPIRHILVHKFPFKILYSLQNDIILVIAFAHQHRKPDYWIERE